jgi:predicted RNase H-like nuclease (RuvC/YqgF family)
MSKTFKIVLALLLMASITSAVMAVFAFIGKEREYMKRLLVEDKLAATLKEKRRIEKEIEDSKKAAQKAEAKVSALQADIEKAAQQVEEEQQKNKTMASDLADKKQALETLEKNLEKEKQEKLSISKKLEDVQFDYEKVKKEITRIKNENTMLEGRISDLKEKSVDLDRIVVKPESNVMGGSKTPARELLRGRVLVVNKEYNFIVIDVGQNDGVEKGIVIEIREGTELLGRGEIDKVYETMSSATLLPGANINFVKKGNLVIESR